MQNECPKKKLGIRVRQIGDTRFLVYFQNTYQVNEITIEIIKKCDGKHSVTDIINEMAEKYPEVSRDEIQQDVQEVITQFRSESLIS